MDRKHFISLIIFSAVLTGIYASAFAAEPKYKADVPKSLITPDKVQDRIPG